MEKNNHVVVPKGEAIVTEVICTSLRGVCFTMLRDMESVLLNQTSFSSNAVFRSWIYEENVGRFNRLKSLDHLFFFSHQIQDPNIISKT